MFSDPMTWEGLCPLGPDCPFPSDPDWHIPHCGHGLVGHHHHWPPRSRGGKRIVTFICPTCHHRVGEGRYGNAVKRFPDGTEHYLLWDVKGHREIADRIIGRWKPEEETVPAIIGPKPKVQYKPTQLMFPPNLSFDDWQEVMGTLAHMHRSFRWWVGDALNYGEDRYGEKYAQWLDSTGLSYPSLADTLWVARQIEPSRRRENLSWSHHREIAGLDSKEQDELLKRAAREELTCSSLRAIVKAEIKQEPECPQSPTKRHEYACKYCGKER